jgi:lipopolysaccharide/colanic/teichoic acid biosynthesis glycosyltransferase
MRGKEWMKNIVDFLLSDEYLLILRILFLILFVIVILKLFLFSP